MPVLLEGKSPALAHELLNLLRGFPVSPPAGGYFHGLGSDIPANNTITELTGNGYARVLMPPENWSEPSDRLIKNAADCNYPVATGGPWLTALSQGLYRALTGGTPDFYGLLEEGKAIAANSAFYFDAGDLSFLESRLDQQHKSTFLAHKVLGLLRGISILPPEELWISLGTTKKVVGENVAELLSLPRAQYSVGTGFWTEPALRKTLNTQQIIWDKAPIDAPDLWSFAIFTQQTGGIPWWFGTVNAALVVKEKDRVIILPNGLQVEE